MSRQVNYSGLFIAGTGFFLTRFTVTLALYEEPVRFYFAGVVPLVLGLGLAAFGVALAVADVDVTTVRTTAVWCGIGLTTMFVLVLLTLLGSTTGQLPDLMTVRSQAYLSNFLIGGSVGGTMTGLYAARNRRHRGEIERHANRLRVLNRLLRHEILNSVNVIGGYVQLDVNDEADVRSRISDQAESIERTVEEVGSLARSPTDGPTGDAVDLIARLASSIERVEARHPGVTVEFEPEPSSLPVGATPPLEGAFTHLLENAVVHADDDAPVVTVSTTETTARVRIADTGPGLPDRQRALLETGAVPAFDDPSTGFGLNVVRLLVEEYGGSIETAADGDGTAITVELPRAFVDGTGPRSIPAGVPELRPALPHLVVIFGASIAAGVLYGAVSAVLGGSIAGIGVFYGAPDPVIGWITHEFHSVVFGFVFAGLLTVAPDRYRNSHRGHIAIGLGWAVVLWTLAAGVVAPVWLRLLGIPAPIPNLSMPLLASHLVWGASLGALTSIGYDRLTPWLAELGWRSRWLPRSVSE